MKKFLITSLLVFAMLYALWDGYISYKAYQQRDGIKANIISLQNSYALVKFMMDEETISADYIGSNGNIDFQRVQSARKKSDEALHLLPNGYRDEIEGELNFFRAAVDVLKEDIIKEMISHNSLSNHAAKVISDKIEAMKENLPNEATLFDALKTLSINEVQFNNLKSYYHYLVLSKRVLKHDELKLLDSALNPKEGFSKDIEDESLSKALKEIDIFQLHELHTKILQHILDGNYQVEREEIDIHFKQLFSKAASTKRELLNKIEDRVLHDESYHNRFLTDMAIALLLLIFLIIILFFDRRSGVKVSNDDDQYIEINSSAKEDFATIKSQPLAPRVDPKPLSTKEEKTKPQNLQEINTPKVEKPREAHEGVELMALRSFQKRHKDLKTELEKCFEIFDRKITLDIDESIKRYDEESQDALLNYIKSLTIYIDKYLPKDRVLYIDVENIAEMKSSSALKFTFKDLANYLDEDDKKIIQSGKYSRDEKSEFIKILKQLSNLNAIIKVENDQNLTLTLSLKKR